MRAESPVVIVEPSPDTPLVWFDVSIRGGASADPLGIEGLHRHAAMLARRGAGRRDRAELDETLDSLGAALDLGVSRDAVTLSGVALSRHLDAVIDLAADILAEPRFAEDEHAPAARDPAGARRDPRRRLGARDTLVRLVVPSRSRHGRTSLGTEASIARSSAPLRSRSGTARSSPATS
ncbi:MAG: insulinase family protein [Kofleriaceae bacterium]